MISWLQSRSPESLYLSVVTVGELMKGIAKRGGDQRALALEKWLKTEILVSFADRIIPVRRDISLEWGRICGEAERMGRKRPAIDAIIVATALVHGLELVTRNVDDMAGMGVPIFNPFNS